jgi:hypothetical protein
MPAAINVILIIIKTEKPVLVFFVSIRLNLYFFFAGDIDIAYRFRFCSL